MNLFLKDELNEQFDRLGFVKIEFLSKEQCQELKKLFNLHCKESSSKSANNMYFSLMSNDRLINYRIRDGVRDIFEKSYKNTFINYRSLAESFLAKTTGNTGDLALHQDWNYVDEKIAASATVWCPIDKITRENGVMCLLPGSHKFFKLLRSATLETGRVAYGNSLAKYIKLVEMREGEVLIFHQALWHGSYPNLGNENRIIATSILIGENEKFNYYHKDARSDNKVEVYELNDAAFLEELPSLAIGNIPINGILKTTQNYEHYIPSEEDLLRAVQEHSK